MNRPLPPKDTYPTSLSGLSQELRQLGAISTAVFFQRGFVANRLDEPQAVAYPVIITPLSERGSDLQFQEKNLVRRRTAIARTTLRLATSTIHGKRMPSSMNPRQHDVFSYTVSHGSDRVVHQTALDRTSHIDESSLKDLLARYRHSLGELATQLYNAQLAHHDPSEVFGIDHEPSVPNASLFTFDMTASSTLTDTNRRRWLNNLDQFELEHLGDVERIKESGDSRTYMRFMTKEEARSGRTFNEHTASYLMPFAEHLYDWHHRESGIDGASHPLRSIVYPAWIDVMDGGEYSSNQLWQAGAALKRLPRDEDTLTIVHDQRDIDAIAA